MKKIYLFAAVLCSLVTANAQINKGSVLLGGQLSYNRSRTGVDNAGPKSDNGLISISLGKAFAEKKVTGINIGFFPSRQKAYSTTDFSYKANTYQFGVFHREYKRLVKDLYIFGQADAAYTTMKRTERNGNSGNNFKMTQNGGLVSLTPGISYQILKKLQLELLLNNVISMSYSAIKEFRGANMQTPSQQQKLFSFNTYLTNTSNVGSLGIGFRFVL